MASTYGDKMRNAYDEQNKLMDGLVDHMHKYEQYGQYQDHVGVDVSDVYQHNIRTQLSMLDLFDKDIARIQNTFGYNRGLNINQNRIHAKLDIENEVMKNKYDESVYSLDSKTKQHLIYQYYYRKQRAQLNIAYSFVLFLLFCVCITYLNRTIPYFVNDLIYIFTLGIGLVVFVIDISFKLYDISIRDDHNFDEYDGSELSIPANKRYVPKLPVLDKDSTIYMDKDKEMCFSTWENRFVKNVKNII